MGFLQRLGEGFKYVIAGQKAIGGLEALIGADGTASYPKTDFVTLSKDGYEKNAVIYACINELGSSASEPRLIVETKNRKGEWEEKPEHSLAKLLQRPNPEMSGYEFLFGATLFQSLAGNAFYEKERSAAGRVVALWPMRPDRVGIISVKSKPGQRVKQRISAYTWRYAADVVQLPPRDVIHFKHPHPRDDLWGLPPLAAAAREGDTDNKATDYVSSFFSNAAVPKGLLKIQGRIDKAEEKRVKGRLVEMYTGRSGWHEPLILGEGSEWVELAETFKDMDFPNLRQIGEARLCMVFQVPPVIVGAYTGLMHSTYSNYAEARKSFWHETLMPLYRKHEDTLNRSLTWPDYGKEVRLRFDFREVVALEEDKTQVWARATEAFKASMITRNDGRAEVGLEAVPGGDVFLQPLMTAVVPAEAEKAGISPTGYKQAPQVTEAAQELYHKAFDTVAHAWETTFRRAAEQLFRNELKGLLKILRKEGKAAVKAAPFANFQVEGTSYLLAGTSVWAEVYEPLIAGLLLDQADNILAAVGITFDLESPEVQAFLTEYTFKFAQSVEGVSEAALRGLVAEAQVEGWSVPQLRKAITEQWGVYDKQRAQVIARTETIRSSNAGTQEAWRLAGIERKQWYASIDGRQCPWCEDMHNRFGPGTVGISMTETFAREGDVLQVTVGETVKTMTVTYANVPHPPLHPQCRCTILAIVE